MPERFVFRQVDYRDIGTFLRDGEIRAKNHAPVQRCHQTSYANLVDRRGTEMFVMPGGGVVNDCVAFYFSPYTSFACAIHRGNVSVVDPQGRSLGQSNAEDRVFLVFRVAQLIKAGLHCRFSDYALNSRAPLPTVTDDLTRLEEHVHWDVFDEAPIEAQTVLPEVGYTGVCRYFNSRATPPRYQYRKEMRMAEFLVTAAVPARLICCMVVENDLKKKMLEAMTFASGLRMPVLTKPGFFVQ